MKVKISHCIWLYKATERKKEFVMCKNTSPMSSIIKKQACLCATTKKICIVYMMLDIYLMDISFISKKEFFLISGSTTPSVKISHSLPDIKEEANKEFSEVNRKVAPPRQTTLPTVPTRHQTFQRQLSHRLDLSDVPFEGKWNYSVIFD